MQMEMRRKKMHSSFWKRKGNKKLVEASLFWESSQDKNQDNNNPKKAYSS